MVNKNRRLLKIAKQEKKAIVDYYLELVLNHQSFFSIDDYYEIEKNEEEILFAMDLAYENGLWEELCMFGLNFCDVSQGYLFIRSKYDELEKYIKKAIEAAHNSKRRFDEVSLRGNLAVLRENYDDENNNREQYEEMLKFYKKNRSEINAARVIHIMAGKARVKGELSEAKELYSEVMDVYKKEYDWDGITKVLNQLGDIARQEGDIDAARQYFEESRSLCVEHNLIFNESLSLQYLASLAVEIGDKELSGKKKSICYSTAINLYRKKLEIEERLKNDSGKAETLFQLGHLFRIKRKYNYAIHEFKQVVEICKELDNMNGIAEGLYNMALAYQERGQNQRNTLDKQRSFDEAEKIFSQCLALREDLIDENELARTICQLGILYRDIDDIRQSEIMHKRSLEIRKRCGDKYGISTDLHQLGILEHERAIREASAEQRELHFHRAESYYIESLSLAEELSDEEGIAITTSQLGNVYFNLSKYELSQSMLEKSISIRNKRQDYEGLIIDELSLGSLYQEIGKQKLDEYDRNHYFMKAEEIYIYCLDVVSKVKQPIYAAKINMQRGSLYQQFAKGDEQVLSFYEKSIPILYDYGELDNIAICKINMSEIYEQSQNLTKAKLLLEEAIPIISDNLPIYLEELIETFNRVQSKIEQLKM